MMFIQIKKNKLITVLLILAGYISLFFGILGLFLPILPTTPFLLLSAYLFSKSSKKMYNWLNNNRYFGKYIKRYREGVGIPLKTKILSVSTLWITIIFSTYYFVDNFWIDFLLITIALIVSYHILSRPTYR